MIYENDKYEIPESVLQMSHEQIKIESEKARQKMKMSKRIRKSKRVTNNGIIFHFD